MMGFYSVLSKLYLRFSYSNIKLAKSVTEHSEAAGP